jgi:hypothetical protein
MQNEMREQIAAGGHFRGSTSCGLRARKASMVGYVSTLMRIQSAFENAGVRFLDNDAGGGIGVRRVAPNP